MNKIKSFEDLVVWQLSVDLAVKLYELTSYFPKEEKYGIIDQIRRVNESIATE